MNINHILKSITKKEFDLFIESLSKEEKEYFFQESNTNSRSGKGRYLGRWGGQGFFRLKSGLLKYSNSNAVENFFHSSYTQEEREEDIDKLFPALKKSVRQKVLKDIQKIVSTSSWKGKVQEFVSFIENMENLHDKQGKEVIFQKSSLKRMFINYISPEIEKKIKGICTTPENIDPAFIEYIQKVISPLYFKFGLKSVLTSILMDGRPVLTSLGKKLIAGMLDTKEESVQKAYGNFMRDRVKTNSIAGINTVFTNHIASCQSMDEKTKKDIFNTYVMPLFYNALVYGDVGQGESYKEISSIIIQTSKEFGLYETLKKELSNAIKAGEIEDSTLKAFVEETFLNSNSQEPKNANTDIISQCRYWIASGSSACSAHVEEMQNLIMSSKDKQIQLVAAEVLYKANKGAADTFIKNLDIGIADKIDMLLISPNEGVISTVIKEIDDEKICEDLYKNANDKPSYVLSQLMSRFRTITNNDSNKVKAFKALRKKDNNSDSNSSDGEKTSAASIPYSYGGVQKKADENIRDNKDIKESLAKKHIKEVISNVMKGLYNTHVVAEDYNKRNKNTFYFNTTTGDVDTIDGWIFDSKHGETETDINELIDKGTLVSVEKDKNDNWIDEYGDIVKCIDDDDICHDDDDDFGDRCLIKKDPDNDPILPISMSNAEPILKKYSKILIGAKK